MSSNSLSLAAPTNNLHRLTLIRGLLIVSLCATLLYAHFGLSVQLPYATLIVILSCISTLNIFSWLRLKKPWPVTELEFFSQLMFDLAYITLLLYFCGGANNPFISYFLVPLCIAAATLSWHYAALLTAIAASAYTLLMFYQVPIAELAPMGSVVPAGIGQSETDLSSMSHAGHGGDSRWNMHTLGMWLNFMISALLISYFVVQMASNIRQQDKALTRLREDEMRNQQLMAVATLAAGTAHELGTPLSTIKTLLSEMQDDYTEPDLQQDLVLLKTQVEQCTNTLKNLVGRAEKNQNPSNEPQSLNHFCQELIEQWLILRPEAEAEIHYQQTDNDVLVTFDPTINQSILNLLNNATDACPKGLIVDINWDGSYFYFLIQDSGPGIPMEIAEHLGQAFVTNKGKGFGLGLFLSHASISRYGGEVKLYNRNQGGTQTELKLPLHNHG